MQLKPLGDSSLTFLSGRMLKECSSQNIAQTFGTLSKRLPTLAVIDLNGNCLIQHGFYPKIERESTLSDVLQRNVPETYFLSRRRVECMVRSGKDASRSRICGTITKNYGKQPNIGNYILSLKPGDVYNGKLTPEQIKGLRMLTEVECERLQGFPDDFTKYGKYGDETKVISRINRYALLGNAVSVPVVKTVSASIKRNTAIV